MHPVLFHLRLAGSDLPIYAYGAMLGVALLVGWYVAVRVAVRDGYAEHAVGLAYVSVVLPAIGVGRFAYAAANHASFPSFGSVFSPHQGGLLGVGAFVGGLLASLVVARRAGVPFPRFADLAAPSVFAIASIVRVGCYLYGCDHGRLLGRHAPRFLRAMGTFPRFADPNDPQTILGSPAYLQQMADPNGALALDASHSLPVHPTQLYEVALGLVAFAVAWFGLRRSAKPGTAALGAMLAYAAGRIVIEPLRGDTDRGLAFGSSATMLTSAAVFFAAAAVLTAWSIRDRASRA